MLIGQGRDRRNDLLDAHVAATTVHWVISLANGGSAGVGAGVFGAWLATLVYMYRRDSVELRPGIGVVLAAADRGICRLAAGLSRPPEMVRTARDSKFAHSRGRRHQHQAWANDIEDDEQNSPSAPPNRLPLAPPVPPLPTTRIGQAVEEFTHGHLLNDLRQEHRCHRLPPFDQHLSAKCCHALPKRTETKLVRVQSDESDAAARTERIELPGWQLTWPDGNGDCGNPYATSRSVWLSRWLAGRNRGHGRNFHCFCVDCRSSLSNPDEDLIGRRG